MFFLEEKNIQNKETIIPNVFFEKIMPVLCQEKNAVVVYLYGYYMASNENNSISAVKNNEELANKLKINLDDVLESWDFCEELKLITKHRIDENDVNSYRIEFKDLRSYVQDKKVANNFFSNEVFSDFQNEENKKMYAKIQSILGYPISPNDMKLINSTKSELNISRELVIEAFLYSTKKQNRFNVKYIMTLLKNWYIDGIRTVQDLEQKLQGKEKRYLEYKRILSAMGEYRMPTEPEEKQMDKWLDEYNFNLDSIIEAIYQSTSAKKPTLNYVEGILKNWYDKIVNNLTDEVGDAFETRMKILENLKITNKNLTKQERGYLDEICENYGIEDVEIACKHIATNGKKLTLSNIYNLFKGKNLSSDKHRKVTKQDIEKIKKDEKIYKQTIKIIDSDKDKKHREEQYKRDRIEKEKEEKLENIYKNHPQLREIEREITLKNIEVSKLTLFSGDAEKIKESQNDLELLKLKKQKYLRDNNIEM